MSNEIPPGGRLASLWYWCDAVPAQNVAHGLVGDANVPRSPLHLEVGRQ